MDSGDISWMLTASALVLFMTPGLALFYGGLVRGKNVLSILMQCFWAMAIITVIWVVIGFSLVFSTPLNGDGVVSGIWLWIGDVNFFVLKDIEFEPGFMIGVIFQLMFAIITPALIIGAFAERLKFSAYTWFIGLWSLIVYVPIAHWVWGGGWLSADGPFPALDFAGGAVIHVNAGIAALVAAIVVGKRIGWPQRAIPPHNLTYTLIGAGILWFGWFGFNAGSAGEASPLAVNAFLVTQISAATSAMFWALTEWVRDGKPTTLGVASGAIAGLVGITPAAGFVGVGGALAIGLVCGIVCYLLVGLKARFGYDDSLDVVAVHGGGGIIGAVLTGVFAVELIGGVPGAIEGNPGQIVNQLIAIAAVIVWSGIWTFIIFKVLDAIIGIRVSPEEEEEGLDLTEHAESGYAFLEVSSTVSSDIGASTPTSSASGFTRESESENT